MRHFALITLFISASALYGQQLTEKVEVNLVNVDVTVTSHGAPARGLTRDDFEVFEDGVPQTITNFYAIEGEREKAAPPSPAPPQLTSTPQATAAPAPPDERFRRKVLVIVDNRHTSRHNRDVALQKLEKFINERFESGTYDWSIAMITDRTYLLLPLTSDKARIHEALATVRDAMAERTMRQIAATDAAIAQMSQQIDTKVSESAVTVQVTPLSANPGSTNIDALNRMLDTGKRFEQAADVTVTYSAIRDATRSFANTPGRKIILLLTGAFSDEESPLGAIEEADASRNAARLTTLRQRLIREANVSDASLYIIDTEGLVPLNAGANLTQSESNAQVFGRYAEKTFEVGGPLYWIAQETGGRLFAGNFVESSLHDFDTSSSDFYSLAYRPNHPIDGKYHAITVRLKKPGRESLVYRRGYAAVAVEQQLARSMTSAMAAQMQPSTMPLTMMLGAASAPDAQGGVIVPVYASVPASQLQFIPVRKGLVSRIDVFLSVFDQNGHLVTTFRNIREARANPGTESNGNFVESEKMRLRKGVPYRIVVAVHDQVSDAVGIASQDVRF